jgi:transmembrane sensor
MSNSIDWAVLARYLADACTAEEAATIDAWLDADPTRRQLMDELKSIWAASDAPVPTLDDATLEADWNRLAITMDATETPAVPPTAASRPDRAAHRRRPTRSHVSALQSSLYILAALLLVGGAWLGWTQWGLVQSTPAMREVIAERGERANIQLVDGTRVTLNVDSQLRLPTSFSPDARTVYLEGEAYFDVATDSTRPFIVRANDAVIDVHGTSFNVRSYPEDRRVHVAVVEGAVSLRSRQSAQQTPGARLESGQVGQLTEDARVTTATVADVSSLLGWMQGRLVFQEAPLPEVTARLERWYNMRFHLADPRLDSLRLTANLKSRSVENVLEVVSASLGIQYRIQDNTVTLADRTDPASRIK